MDDKRNAFFFYIHSFRQGINTFRSHRVTTKERKKLEKRIYQQKRRTVQIELRDGWQNLLRGNEENIRFFCFLNTIDIHRWKILLEWKNYCNSLDNLRYYFDSNRLRKNWYSAVYVVLLCKISIILVFLFAYKCNIREQVNTLKVQSYKF